MKADDILEAVFEGRRPRLDRAVAATLRRRPPLAPGDRDEAFRRLPERHRRLLAVSDGMDLLAGSYRLFGWANRTARAIPDWNSAERWKFAWAGHAAPWLCFGESVLGNQFAYREEDLAAGGRATVFELYAVTLEPLCEYRDFVHFFDGGFLNGVMDDDYHRRIAAAREQLGGFDLDQHLAYMPSPLLAGGRVDVQQLMPMRAEAHMIVNGDLWRQLAHLDSLEGLHGLENYTDREGRLRLRPVWGSARTH
ncbi:MAG: hypothetical protein JO013_10030 [Alphaproteobacteria bacterium]|nr:hypothetical protein [Alphaproteobacteria bacterium]